MNIKYIMDNNYLLLAPTNETETRYLLDYKKGIQDILTDKIKHTRPEINNTLVENWIFAHIEFKKGLLLGKSIQYVKENGETNEEVSQLNDYMRQINKGELDSEIYDDCLTVGRGFRYNNKNLDVDKDILPFETINCDVLNTEVIYSSVLGNKQLMSVIKTPMVNIFVDETGETQEEPYTKYDIYTRTKHYVMSDLTGSLDFTMNNDVIGTPLLYGEHIITEYYINRSRLSLIELGKDLYDKINHLESLDLDDMEQFVNAIMVFTNAEVSEEEFETIKMLGAVSISSTENKKASIELLQSRLNSAQTESLYLRLVKSLHEIVGVPMASNVGNVQMGDTGKANFTGQGFTSSSIRIQNDEKAMKRCDKNSLKTILKICQENVKSKISNLQIFDIDNKFQRDMAENLLVKAQGLQTLLSAGIPEEFAVPVVNLFPDPNAIVSLMRERINEKLEQEKQMLEQQTNINNQVNEDKNKVQDTIEKNNQNQ